MFNIEIPDFISIVTDEINVIFYIKISGLSLKMLDDIEINYISND